MGLEGIMLSEISQTKINTIWSHLYVESLKKKKKLIDTEERFMVARSRGWGRGVKRVKGIKRYKLSGIKKKKAFLAIITTFNSFIHSFIHSALEVVNSPLEPSQGLPVDSYIRERTQLLGVLSPGIHDLTSKPDAFPPIFLLLGASFFDPSVCGLEPVLPSD